MCIAITTLLRYSTQSCKARKVRELNRSIMELLSWSLNAIDRVFSTRQAGPGEPACPEGTFQAGYIKDAWGKWRTLCLTPLDIEDVEDVYLFVNMTVGMLALGFGLYLTYKRVRKIGEVTSAIHALCLNRGETPAAVAVAEAEV